jgi:hypothetical protein|tara:strand:+ start:276 stop:383 length:108 start_codon:yes stop_codon:yes gene_type:complete
MDDKEMYIESCMEMGMTRTDAIEKWNLKQDLDKKN